MAPIYSMLEEGMIGFPMFSFIPLEAAANWFV